MEGATIMCMNCKTANRINSNICSKCKAPIEWLNENDQTNNNNENDQEYQVTKLEYKERIGSSKWLDEEGRVIFRVWAHDVVQVTVIGDFNKWNRQTGYSLYLEDENVANEENMFSGIVKFDKNVEQIEYHFLLEYSNGDIMEVNDVRAMVLVPAQNGLSSVLKKIDLELQNSHTKYEYVRRNYKEMVIYELHIGSFGESKEGENNGTFKSIIDRIEYLQLLGVNAVEIMPIHQDLHQSCWGYDPISLFAIHFAFGSPHDLRDLVLKFHEKDIAVIIDWVPNHICPYNILSSYRATQEKKNLGIYFYPDKERRLTGYGPRLDYTRKQVRSYIFDSAIALFHYFNVDGIRVDSTITMRNAGMELVEAWTLLQSINDYVHRHLPGRFMIAEDLQDKREINSVMSFDAQWDAIYHTRVYQMIININDGDRDMEKIREVILSSFSNDLTSRIVYVENHDTAPSNREKRLPHAIVDSNLEGENKFFACKRATLATSILFCTPGMPMILMGQENLDPRAFEFPFPPTIDFDHSNEDNTGLFELYQVLISLRRNLLGYSKGLTGNTSNIYHLNNDSKIIVIHRYDIGGAGDDVIAIFNCSNNCHQTYRIGFPRPGIWRVRFNSDSKYFFDTFQGEGPAQDSIVAEDGLYDSFFWSAEVKIGRYSALILSQDPPYPDPLCPVVYD